MLPVVSDVHFRQALASDIDALFDIEQQSFRYDRLSRRSLLRLTARHDSAIVTVAVLEGRVVGYIVVLLRRNSQRARIYSLAVHVQARGKHIGKNLIDHALAKTKALGKTVMSLEVKSDNKVAIRLYEKLGFHAFGKRRGYYQDGKAAILYQLKMP